MVITTKICLLLSTKNASIACSFTLNCVCSAYTLVSLLWASLNDCMTFENLIVKWVWNNGVYGHHYQDLLGFWTKNTSISCSFDLNCIDNIHFGLYIKSTYTVVKAFCNLVCEMGGCELLGCMIITTKICWLFWTRNASISCFFALNCVDNTPWSLSYRHIYSISSFLWSCFWNGC